MSIQMYRLKFRRLYRYKTKLSAKQILECVQKNQDAPTEEEKETWILESMRAIEEAVSCK